MPKAKVTWLGEGDEKGEVTYYGQQFKAGQTVEVDDDRLIEKARGSKYFKVEDQGSTTGQRVPTGPQGGPATKSELDKEKKS